MSKQLLTESMAQLNSFGEVMATQLSQTVTAPGTPTDTAKRGTMALLKRLVTTKDSKALTADAESGAPSSQVDVGPPKGPWFDHFRVQLNDRDQMQRDKYMDLLKKNPVVEVDSDSNMDLTTLQLAMANLEARYRRNRLRYLIAVAAFLITLVLLAVVVIVILTQEGDAPDPCTNFTRQTITTEDELNKVNQKGCNHFLAVTFSKFNGVGTLAIAKSIVNLTIECSGMLSPTTFSFPNLSNASLNIMLDNDRCNGSHKNYITQLELPRLASTDFIQISDLRSVQNLSFPELVMGTTVAIRRSSFIDVLFPKAQKFVTFELADSIVTGEISLPVLDNISVLYITDINSEIATDVVNPNIFTPGEYDIILQELQNLERNGEMIDGTFPRNITLNLRSLTTALNINFNRLYFFSDVFIESLKEVTDGVFCGLVVSAKVEMPSLVVARNLHICDSYLASAVYEFMALEKIDTLEISNNIQHIVLRFPGVATLKNIKVQQNGNFTLEGLDELTAINSIVLEDTAGVGNLTFRMAFIDSIVIDRCDVVSINLPNWTAGSIAMFSNNHLRSVSMPMLKISSAVVFFLNPRLEELYLPSLVTMKPAIQSSSVFWAIFVYGHVELDLFSSYCLIGDSSMLALVSAPSMQIIAQNHEIRDNPLLTNVSFPMLESGNGTVLVSRNEILQEVDFGELVLGNITVTQNALLCLPSTFPNPEYPLSDNSTCSIGGNVLECDTNVTNCGLV